MMDINDNEFVEKFIVDSVRLIKKTSDTFTKSVTLNGGFTIPQLNVMRELVTEDGLSLKELSKRLNLSHSTVSGIIDRLETRGTVIRRQDTCDGRFTRIFMSEKVNNYIKNTMNKMYTPFINAIQNALPEEKTKILEGLSIFCRLLKKSK
ncbi:MarR family transcriptional regulator [Clostridium estertheticum]|uniref:MarR family winged helix-turn-helix transcriptional regulator n=1 Tax=Clostridium estertheticum TaxID=238834 RepID=UPI001CF4C294|nr:MarR family transcriptional regulator [Clostridium estertheticum]MCB2305959.1 MarR family transcriptional regulator [Clostridium estertheticum]MCB2345572.1 MarR family transcriptional regulator [Clostridium estertheticum]MCB2349069.1 MarR family transcriptional regulator [Clostridium estertheticum]WAG47706.1 MarR family transcriptional regulator [Clostridium estertheticum]